MNYFKVLFVFVVMSIGLVHGLEDQERGVSCDDLMASGRPYFLTLSNMSSMKTQFSRSGGWVVSSDEA